MTRENFTKKYSAIFALVLTFGLLTPLPALAKSNEVCENGICTVTFTYTGQTIVWYPPKSAKTISFQVKGAQGGDSGGLGGEVTGELTNTPGKIFVTVGGAGEYGNAAPGGFNGGGASGLGYYLEGSGGGASDIRLTQDVSTRIVVAGGGGGRGSGPNPQGGSGGGLIGIRGSANSEFGGTGGTQTEGGLGGSAYFSSAAGVSGQLFFGGQGGSSSAVGWGGGAGGGGGYYGGGGGSASEIDPCCTYSSGGGGGSSFTDSNYTKNITHSQGTNSGAGQISFSYQMTPSVNSITTTKTFTNSGSTEFQVKFNTSVEGFDTLDIEQVHTNGLCQDLNLSGSGASYTVNLSNCSEGNVWIRVLANTVTAYGVQGPTFDAYSPVVRIDLTAPGIQSLDRAGNTIMMFFDEEIPTIPNNSIYFESEDASCQIVRIEQLMAIFWEAEIAGCEEVRYSFTILAESLQDHAGNLGPALDARYSFTPDVMAAPIAESDNSNSVTEPPKIEPTAEPKVDNSEPGKPTSNPGPIPTVQPEEVIEAPVVPSSVTPEPEVRDSEIQTPQQTRDQAAQAVVIPREESSRQADSGVWPTGLIAFAVMALGAGLFLVRRDLSNMVRG